MTLRFRVSLSIPCRDNYYMSCSVFIFIPLTHKNLPLQSEHTSLLRHLCRSIAIWQRRSGSSCTGCIGCCARRRRAPARWTSRATTSCALSSTRSCSSSCRWAPPPAPPAEAAMQPQGPLRSNAFISSTALPK